MFFVLSCLQEYLNMFLFVSGFIYFVQDFKSEYKQTLHFEGEFKYF